MKSTMSLNIHGSVKVVESTHHYPDNPCGPFWERRFVFVDDEGDLILTLGAISTAGPLDIVKE